MKKIAAVFFSLLLLFGLSPLSFGKPTFAQNLPVTFSFSTADNTVGSHGNIAFSWSVPVVNLQSASISTPAGWELASGLSVGDNLVVATGTNVGVKPDGSPFSFPVTFYNDQADIGIHRAVWKTVVGAVPYSQYPYEGEFLIFWDGDISTGYSTSIGWAPAQSREFSISILGSVDGVPVFINPQTADDYAWTSQFIFGNSVNNVARSVVIPIVLDPLGNVNGVTTMAGTDVTIQLAGTSIHYSSVPTDGSTTIVTTSDAPGSGSGQFQVFGGLYYDFNTTFDHGSSCPCSITLPYDPDINSNPRLYHLNSTTGIWDDATTDVDTVNHKVTGVVSTFSFFVVATPNFTVAWSNPVTNLMTKKGNPFLVESSEDLGIKFNLHDTGGNNATPDNVTVQVWQTADVSGHSITPGKVLSLNPELNKKQSRYSAEIDLKKAGLLTGATYEIRVVVDSTVATQAPTAAFKVVGENKTVMHFQTWKDRLRIDSIKIST